MNEDDIRAAIEELNRSTATISKQTETLKQQRDALARLVKKRDEAEIQRRDLEEARLNKTKHALKKLVFEVTQTSLRPFEMKLLMWCRLMVRHRAWSIVLQIWSRLLKTRDRILRRRSIRCFSLMISYCRVCRSLGGNLISRIQRRRRRSRN